MKVLVVDDREDNRILLETMLLSDGYTVVLATDGEEALKILRASDIGLIISDILMPKMDGFQLCKACKVDYTLRKIPFVFYTATYTDQKDEEFALSLGAEKFIVKPVSSDVMLQAVEEVLNNHEKDLFVSPEEIFEEDKEHLQQYNKRLINKLEHKMMDLEEEVTVRKEVQKELASLKEGLETEVLRKSHVLLQAQEGLVFAEKLAAMGQAAGAMSHEIKNQLSIVQHAAYYLTIKLGDADDDVKKHLNIIEKEITATTEIIDKILSFARTQKPEYVEVSLKDMLSVSLAKSLVPEGIKVTVEIEDDLSSLVGDKVQLQQVFCNIMLNAIQSMGREGKLEIKAIPNGERIRVLFEDTGSGLTKECLDKVFTPFFTTKPQGMGFGLSTSKVVIEKHGGAISINNRDTKGAVVTIDLPTNNPKEAK